MKKSIFVIGAAALGFFSTTSLAMPITYSDQASFNAALGPSLITEDLNSQSGSGSPIAITGSTLTQIDSDADDIFNISGGQIGIQISATGSYDITFTFSQAITAFGIEMIDAFELQPGSLTFTTATSSGPLESGTLINNQQFSDEFSQYIGLSNAMAFTEITLTASNVSGGDGNNFDNIGFALAAVPVPASLLLLLLCLGQIIYFKKRPLKRR